MDHEEAATAMPVDVEAVRGFSAAVFRNRYALETMATIAKDRPKPRFYVREIARELGLESNDVRPVVDRLEESGLIRRLPERGEHGAIYFVVEDELDSFWTAVTDVYRDRSGGGTSPES